MFQKIAKTAKPPEKQEVPSFVIDLFDDKKPRGTEPEQHHEEAKPPRKERSLEKRPPFKLLSPKPVPRGMKSFNLDVSSPPKTAAPTERKTPTEVTRTPSQFLIPEPSPPRPKWHGFFPKKPKNTQSTFSLIENHPRAVPTYGFRFMPAPNIEEIVTWPKILKRDMFSPPRNSPAKEALPELRTSMSQEGFLGVESLPIIHEIYLSDEKKLVRIRDGRFGPHAEGVGEQWL